MKHVLLRPPVVAVLGALVAAGCPARAAKPSQTKEDIMLKTGLALLDKRDAGSICKGADLLARSGKREAIEPLLERLRVRDERSRDCVRGALAKLDVAPVLLALWRSKDQADKARALGYAVALPHPGLMAMYEEAARGPDAGFRQRVATGLRRQPEGKDVWVLLDLLVGDPDTDVRWWAVDTLSLSKSADAKRILRERLPQERDANLRTFIERALGAKK